MIRNRTIVGPFYGGACDDNASWAEEPAPAEPGLVHRGEIFFSPGKPEVVPTPRGSRGSKFDLPSPSTATKGRKLMSKAKTMPPCTRSTSVTSRTGKAALASVPHS